MAYTSRLGNLNPSACFEMEDRPGTVLSVCGFAHVKDYLYYDSKQNVLVVEPRTMSPMMIIWDEAGKKYEIISSSTLVEEVFPATFD